jgi:hypothetical protein
VTKNQLSKVDWKSFNIIFFSCTTSQSERCSIPFTNLEYLIIYLWPYDERGLEYIPDLIDIEKLTDNRFTLENAVGRCSTSLEGDYPGLIDNTLYKSCFCCGHTYDPPLSLGCPKNPWS